MLFGTYRHARCSPGGYRLDHDDAAITKGSQMMTSRDWTIRNNDPSRPLNTDCRTSVYVVTFHRGHRPSRNRRDHEIKLGRTGHRIFPNTCREGSKPRPRSRRCVRTPHGDIYAPPACSRSCIHSITGRVETERCQSR